MSKSMKLSAFYEKPELLMKLFGWVSAGVMLFNMVLICCDVFMRYAFNSPIQGTTEIVGAARLRFKESDRLPAWATLC